MSLKHQFHTYVKQQQLLKEGQRVLVLVSGGLDSVALLHLLDSWKAYWKLDLHVLHFNHGLRSEAEQESNFVRDLATQLKASFHVLEADHLAADMSGIQEKARHWRREQSIALQTSLKADMIATAHHADDQIETLLMKWLRGCHLSRFEGMLPQRGVWIKPLLPFKKKTLRDYLESHSQPWVEDASNQSLKYQRNRVRHELIPLMEELSQQQLSQRLQDWSLQSQQLQQMLEEEQAAKSIDLSSLELDTQVLKSCSVLSQESLIFKWIHHHLDTHLSYALLQTIMTHLTSQKRAWSLDLPKQAHLVYQAPLLKLSI